MNIWESIFHPIGITQVSKVDLQQGPKGGMTKHLEIPKLTKSNLDWIGIVRKLLWQINGLNCDRQTVSTPNSLVVIIKVGNFIFVWEFFL